MATCADTQCAFMLANRWLEIWWSLAFLSPHAFCEQLVEELNGLGSCGVGTVKDVHGPSNDNEGGVNISS